MLDEIRTATIGLQAARSRRGHAVRTERRAGVDLLREALAVVQPVFVAEAEPLPPWFEKESPCAKHKDWARGVRVIDYRERDDDNQNRRAWAGWEVWLVVEGDATSFVVGWRKEGHDCDPYFNADGHSGWYRWDHFEGEPRRLGLREAVRRYGTQLLVESVGEWLAQATREHDEAAVEELARAERFRTALAEMRRST